MNLRLLILPLALLSLAPQNSVARAQQVASVVVMLGDSITAGYGLAASQALPSVVERELQKKNCKISIANQGVSGDTTITAAARLDAILRGKPQAVIIALGANDALRGFEPTIAQQALANIITALQKNSVKAILVGMKAPRNWGEEYTEKFDKIFPTLAENFNIPLYPFLLEGVATNPALNQRDGIHPNERGVLLIAQNLADFLIPHLPC